MSTHLLEHPRPDSVLHTSFFAYGFLVGNHQSVWGEVEISNNPAYRNVYTWYTKESNFWLMKFEIDFPQNVEVDEKGRCRCAFKLYTNFASNTPQCTIEDLPLAPLPGGLEILHPLDNSTVSGPRVVTYGTTSERITVPIDCAVLSSGTTNINASNIGRDKDFWLAVFDQVTPATYNLDVHHNADCTGGDSRTNITVSQ